jgi:hypothetical protein
MQCPCSTWISELTCQTTLRASFYSRAIPHNPLYTHRHLSTYLPRQVQVIRISPGNHATRSPSIGPSPRIYHYFADRNIANAAAGPSRLPIRVQARARRAAEVSGIAASDRAAEVGDAPQPGGGGVHAGHNETTSDMTNGNGRASIKAIYTRPAPSSGFPPASHGHDSDTPHTAKESPSPGATQWGLIEVEEEYAPTFDQTDTRIALGHAMELRTQLPAYHDVDKSRSRAGEEGDARPLEWRPGMVYLGSCLATEEVAA